MAQDAPIVDFVKLKMAQITKAKMDPDRSRTLTVNLGVLNKFECNTSNDTLKLKYKPAAWDLFKEDCFLREAIYASPTSWKGLIVYAKKDGNSGMNILCNMDGYNPITKLNMFCTRNWYMCTSKGIYLVPSKYTMRKME